MKKKTTTYRETNYDADLMRHGFATTLGIMIDYMLDLVPEETRGRVAELCLTEMAKIYGREIQEMQKRIDKKLAKR